jgi:hypothetical protein
LTRSLLSYRRNGRSKALNLGLQGGGAHGAFTWGVLDALLAEDGLRFDGVSGASAGAINAVALAAGLLENGAAGARAKLAEVWQAIAATVPDSGPPRAWPRRRNRARPRDPPGLALSVQSVRFRSAARRPDADDRLRRPAAPASRASPHLRHRHRRRQAASLHRVGDPCDVVLASSTLPQLR